jgi:hypothetical protein
MKFLIAFIEIITSPFTYLLKKASGKNPLFPLGRVLIVAFISAILVVGLILLFYRDYIFN